MPAAASSASWAHMGLLQGSSVLPDPPFLSLTCWTRMGKTTVVAWKSQGLNRNPRDLKHPTVFLGRARSGQESATDTQMFTPSIDCGLDYQALQTRYLARVCTDSFLCDRSVWDERVSSANLLWEGVMTSPSTHAVLGVWKCSQIPPVETLSVRIRFLAIKHGRGKQPIILYYSGSQYVLNQS